MRLPLNAQTAVLLALDRLEVWLNDPRLEAEMPATRTRRKPGAPRRGKR